MPAFDRPDWNGLEDRCSEIFGLGLLIGRLLATLLRLLTVLTVVLCKLLALFVLAFAFVTLLTLQSQPYISKDYLIWRTSSCAGA